MGFVFQGFLFIFTRPYLWGYFFFIFLNQLFIFILVFIALLPVNLILSTIGLIIAGPFSHPIVQVIMVQMAQNLTLLLGENYVYKATIQSIFDCVLNLHGYQELTIRGKYVRFHQRISKKDYRKIKIADLPFDLIDTFLNSSETFISLIILLVAPISGPYIIIFLFSNFKGATSHDRYFELKEMDQRQRRRYVECKWVQYMVFGISSGALNLLPIISAVFTVTNICAAALWAIDIEVENQNIYRKKNKNKKKRKLYKTKLEQQGPFSIKHSI